GTIEKGIADLCVARADQSREVLVDLDVVTDGIRAEDHPGTSVDRLDSTDQLRVGNVSGRSQGKVRRERVVRGGGIESGKVVLVEELLVLVANETECQLVAHKAGIELQIRVDGAGIAGVALCRLERDVMVVRTVTVEEVGGREILVTGRRTAVRGPQAEPIG